MSLPHIDRTQTWWSPCQQMCLQLMVPGKQSGQCCQQCHVFFKFCGRQNNFPLVKFHISKCLLSSSDILRCYPSRVRGACMPGLAVVANWLVILVQIPSIGNLDGWSHRQLAKQQCPGTWHNQARIFLMLLASGQFRPGSVTGCIIDSLCSFKWLTVGRSLIDEY